MGVQKDKLPGLDKDILSVLAIAFACWNYSWPLRNPAGYRPELVSSPKSGEIKYSRRKNRVFIFLQHAMGSIDL